MSQDRQVVAKGSLPTGYTNISDILEGQVRVGTFVKAIGLVTDYRVPVATNGKDWKCVISLFDSSIEDDPSQAVQFNIFRPENEMPKVSRNDVVLLTGAKVQRRSDVFSLLSTKTTQIFVFSAKEIPRPPADALCALQPPSRPGTQPPSKRDAEHVSRMFHGVDKSLVPNEAEFEVMQMQSANVKNKFKLLKDAKDGEFVDLVVQVVKEPFDMGDKFTLWVTDFTDNPGFFHYTFGGVSAYEGQPGDPYGYGAKYDKSKSSNDWQGPFGKKSMQITCWEPHASAIREHSISTGNWLSLRNLQIKFGHSGSNLEGFLREDRGAYGSKINITPLNPLLDSENINPNLKEALRRKRDYEKTKKSQLREISAAAEAGQKRKARQALDAQSKPKEFTHKAPSKARRDAKRAKMSAPQDKNQVPDASDVAQKEVPDLNSSVKYENECKPVSSIADILKPAVHSTSIDGQEVSLQLPFVNASYRVIARVVDFKPPRLEDFALSRKITEYDALSDNEGTEFETDSDHDVMADFTAKRHWEWRFYLQIEDAVVSDGQKKERVWVVVDNAAAQCLLNADASDLRRDSENLETIRQRLFLLWGDLEESKSRKEKKKQESLRTMGQQPPMDSSDGESEQRPVRKQQQQTEQVVSNRPFSCCVRQYGVRVPESEEAKADAGDGKRWQRMYSLFGTRICAT